MRKSWRDFLSLLRILEGENEGEIKFKVITDKKFSEVLTVMNSKVKEMLINLRFLEVGMYIKNFKPLKK